MSAPMTQSLVCKFARRTRNFERIYERFPTPEAMNVAAKEAGCSGYDLMERLHKICSVTSKAHRSTFDQERGLFTRVERRDARAFTEDTVHEHSDLASVQSAHDVDERVERCFTMII